MNGSEYLAYNARTMRRILMGELNQMTIRFNIDEKIYGLSSQHQRKNG